MAELRCDECHSDALAEMYRRWPLLRILTVRQPWADLIMAGIKPVENRSWRAPSTLPQWTRCSGCTTRWPPYESPEYGKHWHGSKRGWLDRTLDGPFPFRLGIHAAKHHGPDVREALIDLYGDREYHIARSLPGDRPDRYGALLGTVEVTGCHHADECADHATFGVRFRDHNGVRCSRWAQPDTWHWTLSDPQPLDVPIPMRGRQGLWRLPAEVDADA